MNKSGNTGRGGEHYVADLLRPSFPSAFRRTDRKPSEDIDGTPWFVEVKKDKAWTVQQWIRKVCKRHGPDAKWMLWVVPRDRRRHDPEKPECIVMSKPLALELFKAYAELRDYKEMYYEV